MSTKVAEHNRAPEWRPIRAIPGHPEKSDTVKQTEASWVLPGLWPEGVLLLAGRPKSGKTTLAIGAMVEIACGGEWCGELVRKRRVAVITEVPEQTLSGIQAYAQHMGREGDEAIEVYGPEQAWLPLNRHTDWWRGLLERVGPGGVVFLDTLMRVVRVADWNDAAQVQDALEPLLEEARQRGVSVWIIHHISKAPTWQNAPVGEASVLGSTYLAGAVDVLALLQKKGRDGILVRVQGRGVPETDFRFRRVSLSPTQFLWEPRDGPEACKVPAVAAPGQNGQKALTAREDAPSLTALERRILEDLTANGPSTIREIAARIGKRANPVRKVLYALRDVGLVQEVGERPRSSYRGGSPEKVYCAARHIPEPRRAIGESADILASESTVFHSDPQCSTVFHSIPIYTQEHSLEDTLASADTRQSANGDSISNADITLKDAEPRRNENESSVESARISTNFDHHRADKNAILNDLDDDSCDDEEFARDPLDSLIDYLLDYSRGMSAILPQFFQFLDRRDGILEWGRQLAQKRPEVCLRVSRARAMMKRIVREWEDNRLELEELAADLELISREEADRAWHPEIMKALLAAAFLHDPARMDRTAQFLEEPSESSSAAREIEQDPRAESSNFDSESNESSSDSANPHSNSADMDSISMESARESKESATRGAIPEAPIVRVIYVRGETGICARFLAAQCPYCGGIHEHGGGSGSESVEEFLGVTRAHCVPSGPEYRLVIRGHPEMVHEPLRKATEEAPSGPDPAAEALIEPLLQALDAGIRTDVALAERLKAPRYRVQEALRILAARGQVAAFASDGVCCWARVPRESEDSDSEPDSREVSSIPRESLNFNPESNESLSDSANPHSNSADMDSISMESARNLNEGYREMLVHSTLAARFREVFRERSRRPPADRRVRVPTFERLLERYRELYLRVKARESNEFSNPDPEMSSEMRNSSDSEEVDMGAKKRKKVVSITDAHRRVWEKFPEGVWTELQLANWMGMDLEDLRAILADLEVLGAVKRTATGSVRFWSRVEGASLPAPEKEAPPEDSEVSRGPDPEIPAVPEASPDLEAGAEDPEDPFTGAEITRELLELIWPDLLERAGRRDLSLKAFLRSARIGPVEGRTITLIAPNEFLRDRFERFMRPLAEGLLEDALGVPVRIRCDLSPEAERARREAEEAARMPGPDEAITPAQAEAARRKVIGKAKQKFPGACLDAVIASSRVGEVEGRAITLVLPPSEVLFDRFNREMRAEAEKLFAEVLGGPVELRCVKAPKPAPPPLPEIHLEDEEEEAEP